MKTFVILTLTLVILYLVIKNNEALKGIIESVTGTFKDSFNAVTEVGDFK